MGAGCAGAGCAGAGATSLEKFCMDFLKYVANPKNDLKAEVIWNRIHCGTRRVAHDGPVGD